MSGRSQFSSKISRQMFFHNGPRFLQNGCKTVFSFDFLLACRLKMKNVIWAFPEARFEKHPLNHSLAHSLNFSSPFPNQMRYARKKSTIRCPVLHTIHYLGMFRVRSDAQFSGIHFTPIGLSPTPPFLSYILLGVPPCLAGGPQTTFNKKNEFRYMKVDTFIRNFLTEHILSLKENCRFKCVFFLSSGGAILLTWRA